MLIAAAAFGATVGYDPKADPAKDLATAVQRASAEKKHILVEVGGEWCGWCHRMHQLFEQTASLKKLRDDNYIVLLVNYSEENKNQAFLSQYPKINGYPHIFVLDSTGKLLHSQNTGDLEEGKGYNLQKFTAFLKQWTPKR